jgi:3-hydroxyisobutyrate dehydrogenase
MAVRLAGAGHEVVVHNRTRAKAEQLAAHNIVVAESVADAIAGSECAMTMLADGPTTAAALLKGETRSALKGATVIQMATIGPWESEEIAAQVVELDGEYLEAPVLGSTPQASAGELLVMVGSSEDQFDKWSELLADLGPEPRWVGHVGQAAALKLALNQLIASMTAAFALSLGIVTREGIPADLFMDILRQSALYAPTFDKKLGMMIDRDFANPHFPVHLLLKDVELINTEAELLGLDSRAISGVRDVIRAALRDGWVDDDYSAIYNAISPPSHADD